MNIVTKFNDDDNVVTTYRSDINVSYFTHDMPTMRKYKNDDDNMIHISELNNVVKMSNSRGEFIRTVLYNMGEYVDIESLRKTLANDVIGNILKLNIGRQDLIKTRQDLIKTRQDLIKTEQLLHIYEKENDDYRIEIENYKKQIETMKKEKEEIMEAWIRSKPLPTMDRQVADKYADEFLKKADKKTINDSNDNNNKEKSFKKIKF